MISLPRKAGTILLDDDCAWVVEEYNLVCSTANQKVEGQTERYRFVKCQGRRATGSNTFPDYIGMLSRILYERMVGPIPKGHVIDHINHDTFDNRLQNLRAVTTSQNMARKRSARGDMKNITDCRHFKNIPKGRPWRVQISMGNRHHSQYYATLEEAKAARDKYSIKIKGEWHK